MRVELLKWLLALELNRQFPQDSPEVFDGMGFAPLGQVVEGMDVVDALYGGYGEGAPRGRGPDQGRIQLEGNVYLEREFPRLDYIRVASIVTP